MKQLVYESHVTGFNVISRFIVLYKTMKSYTSQLYTSFIFGKMSLGSSLKASCCSSPIASGIGMLRKGYRYESYTITGNRSVISSYIV